MALMLDHPTTVGSIGSHFKATGAGDGRGIYTFGRATLMSREEGLEVGPDGEITRCDYDYYGAYGFHEWDEAAGACVCGITDRPSPGTGSHGFWLNDVRYYQHVLEVLPYGYVIYLELPSFEAEEAYIHEPNVYSTCTRTLQEMMRSIWEWAQAYENFDNTGIVAETAFNMWNELSPPPQVAAWIQNSVPEQAVSRYLRGVENARERAGVTPPPPPMVDEWLTMLMEREQGIARVRG